MFNDTPRMAFPTLDPKEEGGTGKHLLLQGGYSQHHGL